MLPHVSIDPLADELSEPDPAATVLGEAGAGIAVAANEYVGLAAEGSDGDGAEELIAPVAATSFDASSVSRGGGA